MALGAVTLILALAAPSRHGDGGRQRAWSRQRRRYLVLGALCLLGGVSQHIGIILGVYLVMSLVAIAGLAGQWR